MKGAAGGVSSFSFPAKRGWRGLAFAVLGLVILSMLVPLLFLLGLHNNFHSPETEDPSSTPVLETTTRATNQHPVENNAMGSSNQDEQNDSGSQSEENILEEAVKGAPNKTGIDHTPQFMNYSRPDSSVPTKDLPTSTIDPKDAGDATISMNVGGAINSMNVGDTTNSMNDQVKGVSADDTKMPCELEFGSYCLWRQAHKEKMKDSMVKEMKDQLYVARAYYPIVAKLPGQQKLTREMRQNIQEFEKILIEAATDADLPPHGEKKVQIMAAVIKKAEAFSPDCNYVEKKLTQILDLSEDEAHFHMKQSAFLYGLAVQTMPKSHHCLSMRLTVEYFNHSLDLELLPTEKHANPDLHHYIILSNNVLSASVVINSTVMHSKESQNQVFHIITDGQNYYAMKFWFYMNSFKDATVHVLNVEDINLSNNEAIPLHLSLSEEYRIFLRDVNKPSSTQMNTEYISLFGHTHFLLPEIFQKLKKVVILDDDIVVQRDLSPLWSLQMEGKVIGSLQFCNVRLNQLKGYFGENDYDQNLCSWMSGLNVVDLEKWRELNLTNTYQRLLKVQDARDKLLKVGSFPANLLTFHNLIYALDSSWVLSGLGHKYGIDALAIDKAAVLHYNGNMKPWLDLGIRNYKAHWNKHVKRADLFMSECNVNP